MSRIELIKQDDKIIPKIRGIIHVGAHTGEEIPVYRSWGIANMLLVEPQKKAFEKLIAKSTGLRSMTFSNVALGKFNGKSSMYVSTVHDASSSLLIPKLHLLQYPDIVFDSTEDVILQTLDSLIDEIGGVNRFNFLNIDAQGYELDVLIGGERTLTEDIEYVLCEMNRDYLYENCSMDYEVDKHLTDRGFKRIRHEWKEITWGNALYAKESEL